MATSDYDFLAGAVRDQEYWFQDQRTVARTERRCIKVYQRTNDKSHQDTLHALENVNSLIVGSEQSYRFGDYKQWEADFLQHLLGHNTFEEERNYNEGCQLNHRLCDDHNSAEMRIGKKLTALLRHDSPLKRYMHVPQWRSGIGSRLGLLRKTCEPSSTISIWKILCSFHTGK